MKKIGDIMQELGFNKDAPDSAKEAFVRHLIKASTGVDVAVRDDHDTQKKEKKEAQLSFNFGKGESA